MFCSENVVRNVVNSKTDSVVNFGLFCKYRIVRKFYNKRLVKSIGNISRQIFTQQHAVKITNYTRNNVKLIKLTQGKSATNNIHS